MNSRFIMSTLFIGMFYVSLYSQQYQKEFITILSYNAEIEQIEQKIDSFFNVNQQNISSKNLADYYHDYGKWYYKKWKGQQKKALIKNAVFYTRKALTVKNKLEKTSEESLKKTLYNLGYFNSLNNDFFEAISQYQKIIKILPRDSKTLNSYLELGNNYSSIGDFHKAHNYIDILINLIEKDTLKRKKLLQGYLKKIDIYSLMGYEQYSEKIYNYSQKADSLLSITAINNKKYYNRIYQAEGNRLLKTGYYERAINTFLKVLENLPAQDSVNLAIVHNSLGRSNYNLKNYTDATYNFHKAISYAPSFTATYENLGDLHIEHNEFKKGLKEYQRAINYTFGSKNHPNYNAIITEEDINRASDKYDLLNHLIKKASGLIKYYYFDDNNNHLDKAIQTFRIADRLVDIIRFESTEYKSKLYWREKASALYIKAVEASFLLKKPKDAYYFMEKNKAVLLLEDITNEQAKENAKLPQKLASREYHLKQNIYLSENKLNTLSSTTKDTLLNLKNEVYQNKRKYRVFVDSLHILYPDYAINKQKIKVLPYSSFTSNYISDQEYVLQYIINKDQGFGILHSNKQPIFFKIDTSNKLLDNIYKLNSLLSSRFKNTEQQSSYYHIAHTIFEQLIPASVYPLIKGKNITIITDNALQQLSFETLITSLQTNNYLLQDSEIRYTYSMSYLDQNKQKHRNAQQKFIGIAPVTFNDNKLSSLPNSEKEVTAIASLLKAPTLLLNKKASKKTFTQSAIHYKIIHLSTHANIEKNKMPWIAFRDQKMSLKEIYATKNQSEMVVLSACKTSLGEISKGEGVMSLARGFFYAGANSVISSLWSVNDKANQELMIDFYKGINQGNTKATALRNAKLKYINTHDGSELSPFYWGSLILIGDNTSINLSSSSNTLYWLILLFLVVIIIGLFYFKTKKSQTNGNASV